MRGVLKLPCGQTLQDCTRWIKGIQSEVIEQLRAEVGVDSLQEWQSSVWIKEGIVYDKHDCSVVGFVNLGAIRNAFPHF
jgi:hypothetical protein